jgi:hypothetical protein
MNKQQENIIVTVYVILYIIGLTFYYFNTLFFAYTFLSLAGIMIYKHIKITVLMLRRQKYERF